MARHAWHAFRDMLGRAPCHRQIAGAIMGIIGRQFGRPNGWFGGIAGRFMARNNADLNRWIADQVASEVTPTRIVEIGSGPGVGTAALLDAAPSATVTAIDPSDAMQKQLARRNREAVESGRLRSISGELADVTNLHDIDAVVAVHVLYFWPDPVRELSRVLTMLRVDGTLALGYHLRAHMPAAAQRDFPTSGHQLYEHDDDVIELVEKAGFTSPKVRVLGPTAQPVGRLLLARRL